MCFVGFSDQRTMKRLICHNVCLMWPRLSRFSPSTFSTIACQAICRKARSVWQMCKYNAPKEHGKHHHHHHHPTFSETYSLQKNTGGLSCRQARVAIPVLAVKRLACQRKRMHNASNSAMNLLLSVKRGEQQALEYEFLTWIPTPGVAQDVPAEKLHESHERVVLVLRGIATCKSSSTWHIIYIYMYISEPLVAFSCAAKQIQARPRSRSGPYQLWSQSCQQMFTVVYYLVRMFISPALSIVAIDCLRLA